MATSTERNNSGVLTVIASSAERAGSVVVAVVLLHWSSPRAWAAAAGLAAGQLIAYLWSRSLGLRGDRPDVGNWLGTLGMAALFVESSLLALSVVRVGMERRPRRR